MKKQKRKINRPELVLIGAVLIIVMAIAAYAPALHGDFIWDDDVYVYENTLLTDPDGLKRIWFSTDSPSQYFPMVYTMFRIEHAIWGLDTFGYHLVNVILHAINGLLIWLLLVRLGVPGAWLAAAIFVLHPVHVESVAWITERKNTLSLLFFMLTLLTANRFMGRSGVHWKYYALAFGLFALAMFSKTTACTIPAALLLIVWLRGNRVGLREILQTVPFMLMGIAGGLTSIWWEINKQGTTGCEFVFTAADRILIASRALWFYLGKLVWPTNLAFSYPSWDIDSRDPMQYLWVIACVAAVAALWWLRKRSRAPLATAAFFAAMLAPMLGFINLYTFRYTYVADHYQYVASIAPIALFAAFMSRKWPNPLLDRTMRFVIPCLILIALGILTWRQSHIYADSEAIWTDVLAKNPTSFMALNNMGNIRENQGLFSEAVEFYREAVKHKPDLPEAHLNLGILLNDMGRHAEAVEHFETVVELEPNSPVIFYNYGVCLQSWGKLDDAIEKYQEAVRIAPEYALARDNLGVALIAVGQFDQALHHLQIAMRLTPEEGKTHNNIAVAYYNVGNIGKAWEHIRLAREYGFTPHPGFLKLLAEAGD